jgi:two-component system chemotaxis response regulator CheY
MRVLAVDDSPVVLEMISVILREKGHEVLSAVSGMDALRTLEAGTVDLLLSDVNMAQIDGFQLAGAIRKEKHHEGLPIILMTTSITPEFKARCRNAGGTGWICKPFKPDELLSLVDRFDN